MLSLVMWVFFYYAAWQNGWKRSLTFSYGLLHFLPALVLLALFIWSMLAVWKQKRLAPFVLVASVLLSVIAFTVESHGEPQFQRVWFENERACSSRQNYYCTWWWWQPRLR